MGEKAAVYGQKPYLAGRKEVAICVPIYQQEEERRTFTTTMVEASEVDWSDLNSKLPIEKNDEERSKRKEMFKGMDPNQNGYLSLSEVRAGNERR